MWAWCLRPGPGLLVAESVPGAGLGTSLGRPLVQPQLAGFHHEGATEQAAGQMGHSPCSSLGVWPLKPPVPRAAPHRFVCSRTRQWDDDVTATSAA